MRKKRVLQDHAKVGKTLIPPLVNEFGPMTEVSWEKSILPEILWVALLQEEVGWRKSVDLATKLGRFVRDVVGESQKRGFLVVSGFERLAEEEKINVLSRLQSDGVLKEFQNALTPLIELYPECPLTFLRSEADVAIDFREKHLNRLKSVVRVLFDRDDVFTVRTAATTVWLAFDAGLLKATEGTSLARFPEIEDYPDTELSQAIAGAVRNVLRILVGEYKGNGTNWPQYFWDRGMSVDKCTFNE